MGGEGVRLGATQVFVWGLMALNVSSVLFLAFLIDRSKIIG